jgi:N-acetyl-anhydromuramyl-L-alanine amidase AmpD
MNSGSNSLHRRLFMKVQAWWLIATAVLACGAPPDEDLRQTQAVELPGTRNDALRAAAQRHQVPLELLMAVAEHQGHFELPNKSGELLDQVEPEAPVADGTLTVPDPSHELAAPEGLLPSEVEENALETGITEDPELDIGTDPADQGLVTELATDIDADDPEAVASPEDNLDLEKEGSAHDDIDLFGVMLLSQAQVTLASSLTGQPELLIKTDTAANIDAAAALLSHHAAQAGVDTASRDLAAWKPAIAQFLEAADDVEVSALAMESLQNLYLDGFNRVTEDGERLTLQGMGRDVGTALQALTPGQYPKITFIPASSSNYSSRSGGRVRYVVIHDIEGRMDGAIAVFRNPARAASAHYIIRSSDGHIVQMVRESMKAWHSGHGFFNANSIGIEHEGFANQPRGGGFYTQKLYERSAQLTCAIAKRYHIPIDRKHIFGHGNVPSNLSSTRLCSDAAANSGACGGLSHHHDPGKFWSWSTYMKLVARCVKGNPTTPPPSPSPDSTDVHGLIFRGTDNTKPIAGATVRLGIRSTKTDANGHYAFANVVVRGARNFTASAPGFLARTVSRTVSGTSMRVAFGLTPSAPAGTAVLVGVVYKGANDLNRVAGATVKLSNGRSTTTNKDGIYRIGGLAPNTYRITAVKAGVGRGSTSRAVTNGTTTWGSVRL